MCLVCSIGCYVSCLCYVSVLRVRSRCVERMVGMCQPSLGASGRRSPATVSTKLLLHTKHVLGGQAVDSQSETSLRLNKSYHGIPLFKVCQPACRGWPTRFGRNHEIQSSAPNNNGTEWPLLGACSVTATRTESRSVGGVASCDHPNRLLRGASATVLGHRHGLQTAHPNAFWMGFGWGWMGFWMGMDGRLRPTRAFLDGVWLGIWMGVSSRWRSHPFRPCVLRVEEARSRDSKWSSAGSAVSYSETPMWNQETMWLATSRRWFGHTAQQFGSIQLVCW